MDMPFLDEFPFPADFKRPTLFTRVLVLASTTSAFLSDLLHPFRLLRPHFNPTPLFNPAQFVILLDTILFMQPPTSSPSSRTSPSRPGRSPRATTQSQAALLPDDTTPSLNQSTAPSFTTSLAIAVEGVIHIDKSGESSVSVSTNMPSLSSISTHAAVNSISQSQSISTAVTPGASSSATVTNGESRRAPRKSKTDALAALNVRSRSPSFGLEDVQTNNRDHPNITSTPRQSTPIQVSPKLDMSSVKTASPRKPPPRTKQRPFGLEDCPVYYPTADEFKNPMVYIRSISEHARKYGICKIVPPEGWKMPFATDTEARLLNLLNCG